MKSNSAILGFILGILTPMIGFFLVFLILGHGAPLTAFLSPTRLPPVLSLSALTNIIPFLIFTNRRLDQSAQGVFVATVLYLLVFIWFKFVY